MKKTALLLVLLFAAMIVATPNPVDQNSAKKIGAKFLTASVGMRASAGDLTLVKTYRMGNGDAAFYVFSTLNGFVIVSAQDVATPILGYSDEGPFDANDIPEQMEWWLGEYVDQIRYCVENNVVPFKKTAHEWELVKKTGKLSEERALTAVTPILTSTWHQNWPYNKFCPTAENTSPDLNGHKYAGCVACAMSQVMRKWNYPETGYGSHTYYPSDSPTQSVDFGATTYQWANMPDNITNESSDEAINAIATLMWHAGVAVDMYYGVSGSSCNDDRKIANAFKSYFRYSDELNLEELHSYTASDLATWKVKLRSSLDHGFPIVYTAGDDHSTAGHAFVLDGYSNDGAFHINWGYSGAGNGYFPVGSFNTGGYHYNHAPCAIVNVHPRTQPNGDPWPTIQYQIAVSSNGNGTVSGGNNYDFGSSVTVTATADEGYSFAYWKEENVIVSTDAEYTFTAKYNRNLEAYFEVPGTITVLPNDAAYGTVSGGGTYGVNDNVSLSATANTCYIFENWTKDGMIVSTDNPYSFKANGTASYVANFMPLEGQYIGDDSNNSSYFVPSNMMYKYSITEQIYTSAEIGGSGDIYSIALFNVGYSSGATSALNDITRTFDIYMTTTTKSSFSSNTDWVSVTAMEMVYHGSITFEYGTWTTIYLDTPFYYNDESGSKNLVIMIDDRTGTGGTRHDFKSYNGGTNTAIYKCGDNIVYDPTNMSGVDATRIGYKNQMIVNKSEHTGSDYTITTTAIPEGAGTLTGAGKYTYDAECTVTATPGNDSFVFRHWTKNGKIMSTNPTYTFTVKGNASMVAVFAGPGTVFTSVKPVGTGYVTGDGSFNYGTECTLTATPAPGYAFSKWTINGEIVSTDPTYAFTVEEDVTVVANFRSEEMIEFVDPQVKGICLEAGWDTNGDGEISMSEAAAVTDIGEIFKNKRNITSFDELQFFTGLTSIGDRAFYYCQGLTTIIIPSNVTSIGNSAFFYCNNLSSVTIPNGVESIGTTAFKYCPALTSVTINRVAPAILADNATFAKNADDDLIDGLTIKVPYGSVDSYKSATKWSKYSTQISAIENSYLFSSAGNWADGNFNSAAGTDAPNATNAIVFIDANCTIPENLGNVIIGTLVVSEGKALTVNNGDVLNVTKVDNTGTASRLVINDGGQLICNNPVHATVKKSVAHGGGAKDAANWYTIASPINTPTFDKVTNLIQATAENYDLYRYNETSSTWENKKAHTTDFTTLENGRGYLYWNNTGAELSFAGEVNASNVIYSLTYGATHDAVRGFNLIGNPFTHHIYKGVGGAINDSRLAAGFYVLNNASGWSAKLDYTTPIVPGQGILVETTEAFDLTIANTNAASSDDTRSSNNDLITFNVANDKYEDVAYVQFKDAINLNKIEHINAEIPMLYVHQNDANYAIANMDHDVASFDLNFVAATAGTYTISAKAEGEFEYLHLIDRITGKDIDMLNEGKYTFTAKPTDYKYRFVVKLSEEGNDDTTVEMGNNFAFISNGEIIINGEGTVQLLDMTGRVIISKDDVHSISTVGLKPSVYVLRLIDANGMRVQKIVVE